MSTSLVKSGLAPPLVEAAAAAVEVVFLSLPPHAATSTLSAAAAPPPPTALRNRLRDEGSSTSSRTALSWSIPASWSWCREGLTAHPARRITAGRVGPAHGQVHVERRRRHRGAHRPGQGLHRHREPQHP